MIRRLLLPLLCAVLLPGCSGQKYEDLQEFMKETEKNAPRRIDPAPEVKPYEPFEYTGFDLPDPFRPRKLTPTRADSGMQPDLNRRKEPLESFPLESIRMVGTLQRGSDRYALVRAENAIYRVRKGNYLGQNFGQIVDITDEEVRLKEIVQDALGDWTERASALTLVEEPRK